MLNVYHKPRILTLKNCGLSWFPLTKNVQMSIKMEPELHDQFMAAVAAVHTPAAQVLRQLMHKFIAQQELPNNITIAAMQSADKGEGERFNSADDLFRDLMCLTRVNYSKLKYLSFQSCNHDFLF